MNGPFLALYYIPLPQSDRWFWGDRFIRNVVRRIVMGKASPSGVDMVFINLCKGLELIGAPYRVNVPFNQLLPNEIVGILGRGINCLDNYKQTNLIVAGIGLMTHPAEWPDLCKSYPVKRYLQHSEWAKNLYQPYFGIDICQDIWPVGIDTEAWKPNEASKTIDFLLYNKIHWNKQDFYEKLIVPIKETLAQHKISFHEIEYGKYSREQYQELLRSSRAMIFVTEHESQGLAYQEALSMNVPILAWNPGKIMDPQYIKWGDYGKPASSVPYWDEYCGEVFTSANDFENQLIIFLDRLKQNSFQPRDYIVKNLSLEICAERFLTIVNNVMMENNVSNSQ